jgi:hypothetical protein
MNEAELDLSELEFRSLILPRFHIAAISMLGPGSNCRDVFRRPAKTVFNIKRIIAFINSVLT